MRLRRLLPLLALALVEPLPAQELPLRLVSASAPLLPDPAEWQARQQNGPGFTDLAWRARADLERAPWVDHEFLARGLARLGPYCARMQALGFNAIVLADVVHALTFDQVDPQDRYAILAADHPLRVRHQAYREFFGKAIELAHAHGLRVLLNTDEFVHVDELARWITQGGAPLTADNDRLWQAWRAKYRELFRVLPDLDGVQVRLGEIYVYGAYRGKAITAPDGKDPALYRRIVEETQKVVCGEHKKLYVHRTWCMYGDGIHTTPALYDAVFAGLPREGLVVSVKHTATDFWQWQPQNPTLGRGEPRQIVEFQARHEFDGQGLVPCVKVRDFTSRMRFVHEHGLHGVSIWATEGGLDNSADRRAWDTIPYYGRFPYWTEANLWLLARLMRDPLSEPKAALTEWGTATFGAAAGPAIAELLLRSDAASAQVHYLPAFAATTLWHPSPTRWFKLADRGFDPYAAPLREPREKQLRDEIATMEELCAGLATGARALPLADPAQRQAVVASFAHLDCLARLFGSWRRCKLASLQQRPLGTEPETLERVLAEYRREHGSYDTTEVEHSRTRMLALATPGPVREHPVRLSHGPALGDVQARSIQIWARAERASQVHALLRADHADAALPAMVLAAEPAHDQCVTFTFAGLEPASLWHAQVWASDSTDPREPPPADATRLVVRTQPPESHRRRVRLAFSGDVCGQNIGRDRDQGIPIYRALLARAPDAFLGLGDMIYGDSGLDAESRFGRAQVPLAAVVPPTLASYRAHWRYLRDDPVQAAFARAVPTSQTWDDHEVVNDFGGLDPRASTLLTPALQALWEWNPMPREPHGPPRLYRRLRFGKELEVFVLDTRQYRDPNGAPDTPERKKTMLGREQLAWLLHGIARTDATHVAIATSVPLTVPTGSREQGRDSWADHGSGKGFEQELLQILRALHAAGHMRPLFLTADVHHAEVVRLLPFPAAPEFTPYEIVVGPMQAGLFGAQELAPTLRPTRLFYWSPEENVRTLETALHWFNFGLLEAEPTGQLRLEIVDGFGNRLFAHDIAP